MSINSLRKEQIAKRQESARREQPEIHRERGNAYYGWYRVKGRRDEYTVTAALEFRRRATCTCHDYATNGLDTCKHVEAVRAMLNSSSEASVWRDPVKMCQGGIEDLDVLVFDAETQHLFQDVGGRQYIDRLGLSLGVLYSLRDHTFATYFESDASALVSRLCQADLVIGFNILNFDYPVLEAYGGHQVYQVPTLDMMLLIADELNFRVGLDSLAQATLGVGKSADGLQAVEWYRQGRFDLIEKYCQDDVDVTTRLFLHGRREGHLQYKGRDRVLHTVRAIWQQSAAEVAI